ncbi:MAG: iodotyrosine deiodinase [Verrucomicrobiales bacterium]|jgi:iodotyrosine deiodinase
MSRSAKRIPLAGYVEYSEEEMRDRAASFYEEMDKRRTVRAFADRPIPDRVVELCLRAAATAPSGANQQPWHFAVVRDAAVKSKIREAAEEEERAFYSGRAPDDWLGALAKIGTDSEKPFLETAPCLIAIFQQSWSLDQDGNKVKHYYPKESVGLATGILIAALHRAGLVTLTHTPSPMGFLNGILDRPENEKPFLLLVVGYPAAGVTVPNLERKTLEEMATFI